MGAARKAPSVVQARAQSLWVRPLPVTGPHLQPEPAFLAIANPPQGQPGPQASGPQVVSDFSIAEPARSPTRRKSPRRLGTLSLDRSSRDVPGGLCKPVSMVLVWGWGEPRVHSAASSCPEWPRLRDFPAKQVLGDRPPGPRTSPSSLLPGESLRAPCSGRARQQEAGCGWRRSRRRPQRGSSERPAQSP